MNEHIRDYCKKFIESQENPHYAVFLNGKWGTGKTYFINKLLEEYTDDTEVKSKEIIKISLFGVKSTDEIDMKIYQAVHPILSSKTVKLFGAVIKSAIKLGTSIDLNGDNKDDLSLSSDGIFELKSGEKVSSISKRLIIVDDFERAILSPNQIFGYFSEIITESDTRVIFIGNEDKIFDKKKQKKKEYLRIKEKTIGVEFELEPDKKAAINSFISELSLGEKDFFASKVLDISNIIKCDNLRTIWQALYNLNLFISLMDETIEDEDKEDIFEIFLLLYIQKNLEIIHSTDDISSVITAYYKYNMSYKEYVGWLEKKQKEQKYFMPAFLEHIPLLDSWNKIIFEGFYNKEWLNEKYNEELKFKKQQQDSKKIPNLFILINNWRLYSNIEFEPLVEKVFTEFQNGNYIHPGEILLFANYMIIFSKWELIPDTVDSIISMVNKLLTEKSDIIVPVDDWGMIEMGYGGYAFSTDINEVTLLRKQLKDFNEENLKKHAGQGFRNEICDLSKTTDQFIKDIINVNGSHKYFRQPILSFIDIKSFYIQLQKLDISKQEKIITALSERYGKVYGNEPFMKEYIPDYENLKKLRDLYKENDKPITYNPQLLFGRNIIKELEELIIYFEKHMGRCGVSPLEGVADNAAGGWSMGKAFPSSI